MDCSDFDYSLPKELIAQTPVDVRHESKLIVVKKEVSRMSLDVSRDQSTTNDARQTTNIISHKHFHNIIDYLNKDDILVVNNTKVLPYKFDGQKVTGGNIEVVLVNKINSKQFEARIKSTNTKKGHEEFIINKNNPKEKLFFKVINKIGGRYTIEFTDDISEEKLEKKLKEFGELPLPPYIENYQGDMKRYQTIYSNKEKEGSIAAPTAGLHFTDELLDKIKKKGIKIVTICLHVSFGTFKPVRPGNLAKHKMDPEYYIVDKESADAINNRSGKLFVVGTTTLKTLETVAEKDKEGNVKIKAGEGWSDIFIYPGYEFKLRKEIDGFITNFHLPKSTLLMMLSAYWGRKEILDVYSTAVSEKYRFFSFGDSMLLLK
ncbi:tRNA preQ1(34) S-adenosylmethionine ribosyltransferase-isomerase QueA [Candidatus Woesearchaeota archaeon]|jgi:S-adenosylmethionine:tRNA ribosyltransferase-isomerase|nr:tRNA preQ1(34) S-adenosylmethionine ribosyltransferase-isomerase QueA [Candidatus Woesearchaeota archaeon]MBT5272547.1 tRNA preQ1(34) S-adenosylmethionine ribosyltransferase-isomerase QueA [Candidatus Woesearchaeota archaeon]MBT6041304.1 tRNA preQ1(34) S-adenosylmethionine ribosyltransferase-isomerase QueA [Candidatus Woesearchaeota archaeon]MBT6337099.1 tRNA preQ1(34) S-adenosylmethionine ribosyltransferase-isomerase QueA [Candidatus Woesearchaeota archaeon]MBT7926746.1 tRNA preQ1(34) S-ade